MSPVNKLHNYMYIFASTISSQWQTMTTFYITGRNVNIRVFTYLNNFFLRSLFKMSLKIPDISALFLVLYRSAFVCNTVVIHLEDWS